MTVHPALLKAGATLPHLIASACLSLVCWAALPPVVALGVLAVWLVVSVALALGRLEGPAVRVLWRARPPSASEARLLEAPWQQVAARVDLAGLHLWVGGTGYPSFAAGPHHLVLADQVINDCRAGRLTLGDVTTLILHAIGRQRYGRTRFDLLVGFWTWPWDLLHGLALGIGRRLAWIPLVTFAWRVRFIVATVAVVLETQEGRPQSAIIIATFIALTYLTPRWRRAWEQYVHDRAAAVVGVVSLPGQHARLGL